MDARFIGDPMNPGEAKHLPDEQEAFGLTFERGKWVKVPASLEGKFEGNSHFDTRGKSDDKPQPKGDDKPETAEKA